MSNNKKLLQPATASGQLRSYNHARGTDITSYRHHTRTVHSHKRMHVHSHTHTHAHTHTTTACGMHKCHQAGTHQHSLGKLTHTHRTTTHQGPPPCTHTRRDAATTRQGPRACTRAGQGTRACPGGHSGRCWPTQWKRQPALQPRPSEPKPQPWLQPARWPARRPV